MNKKMITLILVAVALGVGISTFVLNFLGNITVSNAIGLLSIGVICLAIVILKENTL